jgi:hypothetical protein
VTSLRLIDSMLSLIHTSWPQPCPQLTRFCLFPR